MNGKIINKFCGLRSKMYSFIYQDNGKDMYKLKAKGVAKATIEHNLRFEMYEATLFERTEMLASMDLIRSQGWSGGAMVLSKLPVPRRPTNLD